MRSIRSRLVRQPSRVASGWLRVARRTLARVFRFPLAPSHAVALLLLAVSPARADVVVLITGEEIVGRVLSEDFETVELRTRDGDMTLSRRHIAEIRRGPGAAPNPTVPLPVDPNAALPPPDAFPQPEATAPPAASGASEQPTTSGEQVAAVAPEPPENPQPTGEEIVPPEILPGFAAVIFMLDGETLVKRSPEWEPAELGMQLRVSNELRTDEGRTKLMLRGRGEVRCPPRSHLRLDAIDESGTNVTLNLVRGSVWARVEPPATGGLNFNVQTPDLTAGVRGTVFNVSATPNQGSRVNVLEGVVEATSVLQPSQSVRVPAGMSVYCDPQGNLSAPEPIVFDLQREWEEWDQWALQTHLELGAFSPVGSDVIGGLTQLAAADQQLHATMVAEYAANTNVNRQADFLRELGRAFLNYAEDVRDLPPSAEPQGADGWRALVQDPGAPGWSGPYLPPNTPVPVQDGWGHPITYRRRQSEVSGNVFGELISNGPNGVFSQGQADDIREMIVLPDDIQAELRARRRP